MEGKAFAWQSHYIKTFDFQDQSWTQILKDATQRFDDGAFYDPVAELAGLKQGSSLVDYLEKRLIIYWPELWFLKKLF